MEDMSFSSNECKDCRKIGICLGSPVVQPTRAPGPDVATVTNCIQSITQLQRGHIFCKPPFIKTRLHVFSNLEFGSFRHMVGQHAHLIDPVHVTSPPFNPTDENAKGKFIIYSTFISMDDSVLHLTMSQGPSEGPLPQFWNHCITAPQAIEQMLKRKGNVPGMKDLNQVIDVNATAVYVQNNLGN